MLKLCLQSLRSLRRDRLSSLIAVLAITLGIAASLLVFEIVETAIYRPIKGADTHNVFLIGGAFDPPLHDRLAWWASSNSFESMALYNTGNIEFRSPSLDSESFAPGAVVTDDFFKVLHVKMMQSLPMGNIVKEEASTSTYPVFVSVSYWKNRMNGSPSLGSPLMIAGRQGFLAGIVNDKFHFPARTEVWVLDNRRTLQLVENPLEPHSQLVRLSGDFIGRLREGVTPVQAKAALLVLQTRLSEDPGVRKTNINTSSLISLTPLAHTLGNESKKLDFNLLIASLFMFALTCLNAGGIAALRVLKNRQQIAVRLALGASKSNIAALSIIEGFAIAICAGSLGVATASFFILRLRSILSAIEPALIGISIDPPFLLAALALTFLAAAALTGSGLSRAFNVNLLEAMRSQHNARRGALKMNNRSWIVFMQVTLSYCLLAASLQSVTQLQALLHQPLGFEASTYSVASLVYTEIPPNPELAVREILDSVTSHYGDIPAAVLDRAPMSRKGASYLYLASLHNGEPGIMANSTRYEGDFAQALGIPLITGSLANPPDHSVVINAYLARKLGYGTAAYRPYLTIDGEIAPRPITAIIQDIHSTGVYDEPEAQIYLPIENVTKNLSVINLITGNDKGHLLNENLVSAALDRVAIQPGVLGISTGQQMVSETLGGQRLQRDTLAAIALAALLTCSSGLYVLFSYTMTLRTREIAIRRALGATHSRLFLITMAQVAGMATASIAAGTVILALYQRFIASTTFGIQDWTVFPTLSAASITLVVCILTTLYPLVNCLRNNVAAELKSGE